MKIKYLICLIFMIPFLSSCNNEDDVNAIFVSGTWNLINFFPSGWDKKNIDSNVPKYTDRSQITTIQSFTILFKADGTFTVNAGGTISGKWSADGKNRAVRLSLNSSSTANNLTKEFIDALTNAKYYNGTSGQNGFLRFTPDKKSYIQLSHFSPNQTNQ